MPEWHFFAFNAKRAATGLLEPAQEAIRNRDLSAWQAVYDKLNSYHYPPHISGFSWEGTVIGNVGHGKILRDEIPDESSGHLRKSLQHFVELVSRHHLESRRLKLRVWVLNLIRWDEVLTSEDELKEIELFKREILFGRKDVPDPFWCLSSSEVVDANYVSPETVAKLAEVEARVGLLRRLARRTDLGPNMTAFGPDLAAAGLLIELAANLGLALYFREDAT